MELGGSRSRSRSCSCSYKYHISTPLEEEEILNTHLTGEATFLCCTYPLFVVRPTSPLDGKREREKEV
jgi:hypothetical protein